MKIDEITNKNLPCIEKTIKVLKYLNQGRKIELNGIEVGLAETNDDGATLYSTMSDTVFGQDWRLSDFTEACNKLSDEDILVMSAEIALQGINTKNR